MSTAARVIHDGRHAANHNSTQTELAATKKAIGKVWVQINYKEKGVEYSSKYQRNWKLAVTLSNQL